jgi:phage terminase small subunit
MGSVDREKLIETRRIEIKYMLSAKISGLSPLARRFVINFLSQAKPNATQAYIDAGGTAKHADRAAYQLRHNSKVQAVIDEYFHKQEMTAAEVVARVSDVARGDLTDYIDDSGNLDLKKLKDDGKGHLLKKYKRTQRTIPRKDKAPIEIEHIEIELYPSDAAHDKLMRYHALYADRLDANVSTRNDGITVNEWREEDREKRRKQAEETAVMFEDEADEGGEIDLVS